MKIALARGNIDTGTNSELEALAIQFVNDEEFRLLRLGTLLGTTQGDVIVQGVELVAPPFYRQDIELLVDALKLAARMQNKRIAGRFALAAAGLAAATWFAGTGSRKAA